MIRMILIGVISFFITILCGCENEPKDINLRIVSAKMHNQEEHGKPFEFTFNKPLSNIGTYYFEIKFITKNGHTIEGGGILPADIRMYPDKLTYKLNVFVYFFSRHDPKEKWEVLKKHLNPGNIETVSIKVSNGYEGYKEDDKVAEAIFTDL